MKYDFYKSISYKSNIISNTDIPENKRASQHAQNLILT